MYLHFQNKLFSKTSIITGFLTRSRKFPLHNSIMQNMDNISARPAFSTETIHLPSTLSEVAVKVLTTSDPDLKRDLSLEGARRWKSGEIYAVGSCLPPLEPSRPSNVKIVSPLEVPRRGKAGSLQSRVAMLHSLVHIENVAIDLSWDIVARFTNFNLPREFYDDWVKVAEDEARHYNMLHQHLKKLGSYYGAIVAHDGLWDSALETAHDPKARLAIEHIVHEGHGLDVTPKTISRFRSSGDSESADILEVILKEEITHVTAGIKWFKFVCEREGLDAKQTFYELVPKHFRGTLKPPFNVSARAAAAMTEDWYVPLSIRTAVHEKTILSKDKRNGKIDESELVLLTVDKLQPDQQGIDMILKVHSNTVVMEKTFPDGIFTRIAECVVGDPTGSIILAARNEQIEKCAVGNTIVIKNGKVEKNKLMVNRFGRLEVAEQPASFDINLEKRFDSKIVT